MTEMVEANRQQARAEKLKRLLIGVAALTGVATLVFLVVISAQIRATQESGSPAVRAAERAATEAKTAASLAAATNAQILDCLEPTGVCYQQTQDNTGNVVASINELTQYAAVCADRPGPQGLEEIRRCIADLIAASSTDEDTTQEGEDPPT